MENFSFENKSHFLSRANQLQKYRFMLVNDFNNKNLACWCLDLNLSDATQ